MGAATEPDPYVILGVPRAATDAQIRDAYRALGARYHPDRHQGNPLEGLASAKMAEINQAYEILSDPVRRAAYDRAGAGRSAGPRADAADPSASGPGFRQARPVMNRRAERVVAVLILLPLLLRFGGLIARGLTALGREMIEGLTLVRGTPFGLAMVVLTTALVIFALVRRRRRQRRRR